MNNTEWLLRKADEHWSAGHTLPIDLFAALVSEGIDVAAEEQRCLQQPE